MTYVGRFYFLAIKNIRVIRVGLSCSVYQIYS